MMESGGLTVTIGNTSVDSKPVETDEVGTEKSQLTLVQGNQL